MREQPISVRLGLTMDRPVVLLFKLSLMFVTVFGLFIFIGWLSSGGPQVAEVDMRIR